MSVEPTNIESLTLPDLTPAVCASLVKSGKAIQEPDVNFVIRRCRCNTCGGMIETNAYSFRSAGAVILGFRCHRVTQFAAISIADYERLDDAVGVLQSAVPRRMPWTDAPDEQKTLPAGSTGAGMGLPARDEKLLTDSR